MHRIRFRVSRWLRGHRLLIRDILIGFGGIMVVIVLAQLLYPAGRLLPSVEVQGHKVGGRTVTDATKLLDTMYAKAQLTVKTEDKTFRTSYAEAGIDPESWNTARSAARYTFGQRLIPFSSLYIMAKRDTSMQVRFDSERLQYFAQQIEKEGFMPAVNAAISVKNGDVQLVPAKESKTYASKTVQHAIRSAVFAPAAIVQLSAQTKPAERTDEEVKSVLREATRAVNTPLTLKLQDEKVQVDNVTIGGWLDFPEDQTTRKLQLGLKADTVRKYLDSIQSKIYKAPGTTRVQIIDGREAGRSVGEPGQGIDADKTIISLTDAVKKGTATTLAVPIAQLAPKVVYERQYSNTDSGLTALLGDLASAKGFGISVMELGGRSANTNGNKRFVAASTYKLFVAYAVFKQIEAGQMSWSDSISGRSAEACFDAMIVRSDNPCAKAFGDKIGWQRIEDMMRSLGLSNTDLSPSLYTTANDLALFLYKLENGSLVSTADKARLIEAMKRQIYRAGIPAGTGLVTADKVGFIDSYIHDAGIVYGPRGPYVLIIMTSGSSWSAIADASKQINTFLNR